MDAKTSELVKKFLAFAKAESRAFKKAGKDVGTVQFTCPICGGKAIGNRYMFRGRIHGLGSGCPNCGISHS
jgi:predicted RNA-binding Zn-ribbon protein involved in translation (DUF1610 family)